MAFNLTDTFSDEEKQTSGVWVEFYEGSSLLIASKNSSKYKAYLANLARKNKVRIGKKKVSEETMRLMEDITCEAMSKHLLLGWKGISMSGDGEETPYSSEAAKVALLNSSELFEFVDDAAEDSARFEIEQAEELKKP